MSDMSADQNNSIYALVPKSPEASGYWLINIQDNNILEFEKSDLKKNIQDKLIFCPDAKLLINKIYSDPKLNIRLMCLSTIKKLIHKNNLAAELELPQFENASDASSWAGQAVKSAVEKISELNLEALVSLECQVIQATVAMERAGIFFNKALWQQKLDKFEQERLALKARLEPYFQKSSGFALFGPEPVDLQNQILVKTRLEEILGVKLKSTSQSSLKNYDHEVVRLLIKYREHSRMISTYGGENFLNNIKNNRIFSTFVPLGSASGRFTSLEPNVQALPNNLDFQACLIPDRPRKILYFDYGAFELRILAGLSQDHELINIFNNNLDIHSMVAEALFNQQVSKTQNKNLRDQAKALNFGLIYGMGEQALARELNISLENSRELMKNYFRRFPKVLTLLESLENKAKNLNFVNTLMGRRLCFTGDELPSLKSRLARNVPIQGTGADIAKLALCKIYANLSRSKLDASLVNMIHDEFVVECHEKDHEEVKILVQEAMSEAFLAIIPAIKPEISSN